MRRFLDIGLFIPLRISIHAPARGATCVPTIYGPQQCQISIHAPARGATLLNSNWFLSLAYFNPRTREGCDNISGQWRKYENRFQSTHPRGVRLGGLPQNFDKFLFQSTHPRGVRPQGKAESVEKTKISIHAPARGATE